MLPPLVLLVSLLVSSLWALAGCERSIEFRPFNYELFQGRDLVVLNATSLPPVPAELQERAQARMEAVLRDSPHLGRVLTRAEFRERTEEDRIERFNYEVVSDNLSVLALIDRDQSRQLADYQGASMGVATQLLHLRCPGCEERSSRLALTVQFLDLQDARVLWRLHVTTNVSDDVEVEELGEETESLLETAAEALHLLVAPKWHRLRFMHLKTS